MIKKNGMLQKARQILDREIPPMDRGRMERFVGSLIRYSGLFTELRSELGSPLYVVDEGGIKRDLARLGNAFRALPGEVEIYYAMKSNNMREIVAAVVEEGAGLDVSSGLELRQALEAGARSIVFSGPGKTEAELSAALDSADRVTLMIDSFGELDRIDRLTKRRDITVRAGVRLTTRPDGLWRRFGISIDRLDDFMSKAERCPFVQLEGIQFHTSWNLTPGPQVAFIRELGRALAALPGYMQLDIAFIDIGGGFWPESGEWLRAGGTERGRLREMLGSGSHDTGDAFLLESASISEFAGEIGAALESSLPDSLDCRFFIEPGRWLCHQNMHILMTVVDVKGEDIVITDAGTSAVGWERYEHDYFPVVNLSDPDIAETACGIYGSLCTPHDVWGHSYFGGGISPGDLLLVPAQGAYTYSLRQEFIKPLPVTTVVQGPLDLLWKEQ